MRGVFSRTLLWHLWKILQQESLSTNVVSFFMPITREQFDNGRIGKSLEEIICDTLRDGYGYSLYELEQKVGIYNNLPRNLTLDSYNTFYDKYIKPLKETLTQMVQDGKIEPKEIPTPTGLTLYYRSSASPITVRKPKK
ncbi:hypothetical protein ACLIKE_08905 [Ferroplasma acidiphilum]|uniref:Uncharacterized protein n=1 Tax=Ferroplasma acidiphilum TaxID=74969 RepID=A0A7K4FPQ2_9ARCH|nr:hypothetical protein [Ferroplasma acidiphilum]NOL60801.1 hypothetical protein [Ferroplasma acidiphilum]